MGCGQSKINLYPRRNKNGGKGNSAKKSDRPQLLCTDTLKQPQNALLLEVRQIAQLQHLQDLAHGIIKRRSMLGASPVTIKKERDELSSPSPAPHEHHLQKVLKTADNSQKREICHPNG